MPQPAVQSPEWWRDRLYEKLCERSKKTDVYDNYYECEHPLPFLHEKARDPFRRLLQMSRANYMELVVDALVGRLEVAGFQSGADGSSDEAAWKLWQDNGMDAGSQLAFLEAAIRGEAYLLNAPPTGRQSGMQITPEHPSQAITEPVPGSPREMAAGLKLWLDDWTGMLCATVYLPEALYKFQAKEPKYGEKPQWTRREVAGEKWGAANPLGEVPLEPLSNRPRMLRPGASELKSVTGIQDRINKTIADRMMTQEFAAFPQKWVTGMEIPVDETTGQPVQPFDVAVNRILMAEDAGAKFGQFAAADLGGYLKACEADVKDIAAITSTPPHYLLGSLTNLSAEALKAAEAGLIHKVYQRRRFLEEALERTMRRAGVASSDARVVWKSPEWRTEGELVDALVKMSTLGVPREVLWERWGATPQEITRWRELSQDALDRALSGDVAAEYGPKPTATDEPPPPAYEE